MARGPIPDKPATRPTVPEAAAALRDYYKLPNRSNGGAVHIITEDGNVAQGHAEWCVEHAERWARDWGGVQHAEEDVRIARMLAAMTNTQRNKLAAMSFYP